MIRMLVRLFLQPQITQKGQEPKKEMYHFIIFYVNESEHCCIFRTYAASYQAAKNELLRQYSDKKITNITLKSKNLQ